MFSRPRQMKMLTAAILTASLFPFAAAANAQVVYTPGSYAPAPPVQAEVPQAVPQLSDDQIDALTAPIALYPDPLLAQLLPAATYPNDIAGAAGFVNTYGQPDEATIDKQPWDPSVKAIAHYPAVLQYMATHLDWTQALGAAFMNQPQDVMNSIQRLRAEAAANGSLATNQEEQVVSADNTIQILPANAQVIYVPTYDPGVVYLRRSPIDFGRGLAFGGWLTFGFDWGHHWVVNDYDWGHYRPGHPIPRRPDVVVHPWVRDNRRPAPVYPPHYAPRGPAVRPGYEKGRPAGGHAFDANEHRADIQREENRARPEIVHPAVPARPAPHAEPHPAPRPAPRPAPAPRPPERPAMPAPRPVAPAPHVEAPHAAPPRAEAPHAAPPRAEAPRAAPPRAEAPHAAPPRAEAPRAALRAPKRRTPLRLALLRAPRRSTPERAETPPTAPAGTSPCIAE